MSRNSHEIRTISTIDPCHWPQALPQTGFLPQTPVHPCAANLNLVRPPKTRMMACGQLQRLKTFGKSVLFLCSDLGEHWRTGGLVLVRTRISEMPCLPYDALDSFGLGADRSCFEGSRPPMKSQPETTAIGTCAVQSHTTPGSTGHWRTSFLAPGPAD